MDKYQENIEFIMKFGRCSEDQAKQAYDMSNGDVAMAILLMSLD